MSSCCRCPQPHNNWPAADGGLLCQDCWEAESDRMWWATVWALDEAGLLAPHPDALDAQPLPDKTS